MSHFTKVQTKLYNLGVLKKTLSSLNFKWYENVNHAQGYKGQTQEAELIIKQPNKYDIGFKWNGIEYELVSDLMFWDQPYSVDKFLNQVNQRYAYQAIAEIHSDSDFNFTKTENKETDPNMYINLKKYTFS